MGRLLIILLGPSPGLIEWWEALITLLMFPGLVAISWMADAGWFRRKKVRVASSFGHHSSLFWPFVLALLEGKSARG
jgi:hypothetical protein